MLNHQAMHTFTMMYSAAAICSFWRPHLQWIRSKWVAYICKKKINKVVECGMKTLPRDMPFQGVARGMFNTDLHGLNLGQILGNGMIQMYYTSLSQWLVDLSLLYLAWSFLAVGPPLPCLFPRVMGKDWQNTNIKSLIKYSEIETDTG